MRAWEKHWYMLRVREMFKGSWHALLTDIPPRADYG